VSVTPALAETVRRIAEAVPGRLGCHVCGPSGAMWASHRADEQFPTASVIKVPILAALAAAVDAGEHEWDEIVALRPAETAGGSGVIQYLTPRAYPLRDLAALMIIVSDNRATNAIIDLLGPNRINAYCRAAGWPHTVLARRMMDLAARAEGRDNLSTPRETADLLTRLLAGTLVSPAATAAVLDMLRAQQLRHKLPAWLPPDTPAANKTGDMPGVTNDCGILFLPSGAVIAAVYVDGLTEAPPGWDAVREIGRAVVETANHL
jgi:beta-lactamase class A